MSPRRSQVAVWQSCFFVVCGVCCLFLLTQKLETELSVSLVTRWRHLQTIQRIEFGSPGIHGSKIKSGVRCRRRRRRSRQSCRVLAPFDFGPACSCFSCRRRRRLGFLCKSLCASRCADRRMGRSTSILIIIVERASRILVQRRRARIAARYDGSISDVFLLSAQRRSWPM